MIRYMLKEAWLEFLILAAIIFSLMGFMKPLIQGKFSFIETSLFSLLILGMGYQIFVISKEVLKIWQKEYEFGIIYYQVNNKPVFEKLLSETFHPEIDYTIEYTSRKISFRCLYRHIPNFSKLESQLNKACNNLDKKLHLFT